MAIYAAGTSNTTFGYWVQSSDTTATTAIWYDWAGGTTCNSIALGTRAWSEWNAQLWGVSRQQADQTRAYNQRMAQYSNEGYGAFGLANQVPAAPVLTLEQQAEQEAQRAARAAEVARLNEQVRVARERRDREAAIAKRKAEALLLSVLTRAQRKERKERGFFTEVIDGQEYRFHRGTHGNVHLIDDRGAIVQTYCIQPDDVPEGDAHVAQLMMLRHDRERFMRLAGIRNHDPMPAQRRAG